MRDLNLVALALLVASCDRRTVTITAGDPAVKIYVDTNDDTNAAEVKVSLERPAAIVPVIFIPLPAPYATRPILAEKPEK